jgi:hypothetical protein
MPAVNLSTATLHAAADALRGEDPRAYTQTKRDALADQLDHVGEHAEGGGSVRVIPRPATASARRRRSRKVSAP